ncbi:MAG: T9SS type A sorting domain-containing protein [candidate division Zixibacteria bacterium]|nr:T9SS type A sorting domain-containing protein [candidate division Zixibacteria bacterium]
MRSLIRIPGFIFIGVLLVIIFGLSNSANSTAAADQVRVAVETATGIQWDNVAVDTIHNVLTLLSRAYPEMAMGDALSNDSSAHYAAVNFITKLADMSGVPNAADLKLVSASKHLYNTTPGYEYREFSYTLTYMQIFNQLPVYGSEIMISMNRAGDVYNLRNISFSISSATPAAFSLSKDTAYIILKNYYHVDTMDIFEEPELYVLPPNSLIWRFQIGTPVHKLVLINAITAAIELARDNIVQQIPDGYCWVHGTVQGSRNGRMDINDFVNLTDVYVKIFEDDFILEQTYWDGYTTAMGTYNFDPAVYPPIWEGLIPGIDHAEIGVRASLDNTRVAIRQGGNIVSQTIPSFEPANQQEYVHDFTYNSDIEREASCSFIEMQRGWNYRGKTNKVIINVHAAEGPNCYGSVINLPHGQAIVPNDAQLHEFGHAIMYERYGNRWPSGNTTNHPGQCPNNCSNCNNHCAAGNECSADAILEGWANYFPVAVYNEFPAADNPGDHSFDWSNGGSWDLESNTHSFGISNCGGVTLAADGGDKDEAAIATILWDIRDGRDAGDNDNLSLGSDACWHVFMDRHPYTTKEFYEIMYDEYPNDRANIWEVFHNHGIDDNVAPTGVPANLASQVNGRSVSLTWTQVPDPNWNAVDNQLIASGTLSLIQIDEDPNFLSPYEYRRSILPFTLTLNSGTYYWRVRATDYAGNDGANWSSVATFTVPSCFESPIAANSSGSPVSSRICKSYFQQYHFPVIADGRSYRVTVIPDIGNPDLYASRYQEDIDQLSDIQDWNVTCPTGSEFCARSINPGNTIDFVTFTAPDDGVNYDSWFSVYAPPDNTEEMVSYDIVVTWTIPPPANVAIDRGLDWLKAQQVISAGNIAAVKEMEGISEGKTDTASSATIVQVPATGSWSWGGSANAGITALALQAFLGRGYGIGHSTYGPTIERGINYLLNISERPNSDGSIFNSYPGYETAMSIGALKSALKTGLPEPLNSRVQNALNNAVAYYTRSVDPSWPRVSWRYYNSYTSPDGGDMSINQWVYLALDAMNYTDKAIWNKIYNYIDYHSAKSGNNAWIGYQSPGTWTRGNTFAGIWGLSLADNRGVTGAYNLANKMYNFESGYCPIEAILAPPNLHSDCVYQGAGYYYYMYEFAKALELGRKTQFCGQDWYEVMAGKIDCQHLADATGYFWQTGWTPSCGYSIPSGGPGNHGNTALAILSLETGTVPPRSRIRLGFTAIASGQGEDASDSNSPLPDMIMRVYSGQYYAGPDSLGNWLSTFPGSFWVNTAGKQELEIELTSAMTFDIECDNTGPASWNCQLAAQAFLPDNPEPADSIMFSWVVGPGELWGSSCTVNAIGGLSIFQPAPAPLPRMYVTPNTTDLSPFVNDSIYTFSFLVAESSGTASLTDIDLFGTDLTDEYGHVISKSNITVIPQNIDSIPQGGSRSVSVTIATPPVSLLDFSTCGTFTGGIIAQSYHQTRSMGIVAATGGNGILQVTVKENGKGLHGVPIDIYDKHDSLVCTSATDVNGFVTSDSLFIGNYRVCIVPPLGYRCQNSEQMATVFRGQISPAAFQLQKMSIVPAQLSSAYWKHVVATTLYPAGGEPDSIIAPHRLPKYADLMYSHFQQNAVHPINIFGDDYPADTHGKLERLFILLGGKVHTWIQDTVKLDAVPSSNNASRPSPYGPVSDNRLALMELTALMLNIVSNRVATFNEATEDGITVGQLLTHASDLIYNNNAEDDWPIYLALRNFNYGTILATGIIPANTIDIAYMNASNEMVPEHFSLSQNYPNPFNPNTRIEFGLPVGAHVKLQIFNMMGQKVKTLADEWWQAGLHAVMWNGTNDAGDPVATGIYLYRITAGDFNETRKMSLIK